MNNTSLKGILGFGRKQHGVAAVEAAIVLPLVLFVMLVVAEFGIAILQYNRLTQAVRDGARYIAAEAEANPGVIILDAAKIAAASNLVAYGTANASTAAILPGLTAGSVTIAGVNDADVTVTAEFPYVPRFFPAVTGLADTDADATFTMRAQVTMRIL